MLKACLSALLVVCGAGTAYAERLHPGDVLSISVWQDPKLDQKVIVAPDGTIAFPLAGHLKAGGLTPQAVESELRRRLQKSYKEPLSITVGLAQVNKEQQELSRPKVYVTGEVLRPGPYDISVPTNLVQAIALAGGLGPFAAKQRIQLHRKISGQDSIFVFNYNDYLAGSADTENIRLHSGDIIIVPERGLLGGLFE